MLKILKLMLLTAIMGSATAAVPAIAGVTMQSIPVLRHSVKPGETISENDLMATKVDSRRVNVGSVRQASDIVGLAARRPLSPGRQLRLSDFQEPSVVSKGSRVTMVLSAGGLRLTAIGTAMEDGAQNAFIKITNSETRQTVHGRVVAPNLVEVLPVGQLALR